MLSKIHKSIRFVDNSYHPGRCSELRICSLNLKNFPGGPGPPLWGTPEGGPITPPGADEPFHFFLPSDAPAHTCTCITEQTGECWRKHVRFAYSDWSGETHTTKFPHNAMRSRRLKTAVVSTVAQDDTRPCTRTIHHTHVRKKWHLQGMSVIFSFLMDFTFDLYFIFWSGGRARSH